MPCPVNDIRPPPNWVFKKQMGTFTINIEAEKS